MEFDHLTVTELKSYLQERGVTCHLYRKAQLLKLAKVADELKLEVIVKSDHEMLEEYNKSNLNRRQVINDDGQLITIQEVTKIQDWSKDLVCMPDLESGDIMVFLLKDCKWEEERLRNYKLDNGYKLHQANHIGDVEICKIKDWSGSYVKATCIPETRQGDEPYQTWILLHSSGKIQSAGCTCVADDGSCKHCVALLFSIRSFLDRHKDRHSEACTDVECTWDKPRKKSTPMPISDINIGRDQSVPPTPAPTTSNYNPTRRSSEHIMGCRDVEREFYNLFRCENSLILQTIDPPSDYSSDDDVITVPTMLDAIKGHKEGEPIEDHLKGIYNSEVITEIEHITQGQSENNEWFAHRQGRITASLFASVLHFKFTDKPSNYILKKVMSLKGDIHSLSMKFGKDHEPIARNFYFERSRKTHRSLSVKQCGLFLDKEYPYMGASPDGVVTCTCCGKGLLEIKCSYTYQNQDPIQACTDNNYHVYCDENNDLRLKCSSSWYIQVQGQMGVCGLDWCDFVFYTKKGIAIDRITFDAEIYKDIRGKCKNFFEKYVLKALSTTSFTV